MIAPINTVKTVANVQLNKVAPQPKQMGLAKDTFEKAATVSNPISTYQPTGAVYANALGKKPRKPHKPKPSPFTPEQQAAIETATNNMKVKYGRNAEKVTFDKDLYTPEDSYILTAQMKDGTFNSEFYDKDIKKTGEERQQVYQVKGNYYLITKTADYRNNTTSKVRMELDKDYNPIVTDEVRIVRDKDNNIVRKEMMTHSEIDGAYDHKYVYPNGTEKILSKTTITKKLDNFKVINKNLESLDGTKTEYAIGEDDKGNRLLEYKITDKDGKVLMNLNKTLERVGDNKVISSNGDKIHEITFEKDAITVQEKGKEEKTVLPMSKIKGDKDAMISLLKKMPGEQIVALNDTIRTLKGVKDTNDCCMFPDRKEIDTIDDLFSVLHEGGHAIDFKKSTPYKEYAQLSHDKEVQETYLKEKEAFNKAYPNAQREHVGYFTQVKDHYAGKWGGLGEVIAECNALRDSYTTEGILAPRVQYLQQYFPRTMACLNNKLENYQTLDAKKPAVETK